jgi:hypothetical protein
MTCLHETGQQHVLEELEGGRLCLATGRGRVFRRDRSKWQEGDRHMHRTVGDSCSTLATFIPLLMTATLLAAPVKRDDACRAANAELPGFFPGPWHPVGEITLYNLSGDTAAYTFMFARPRPKSLGVAQEENPRAFVAKARQRLAGEGKVVAGDATELYGEDRFASIVISADDTEPPVLRCFVGLPPHVVKEADALALAAKKEGSGAGIVRHYLMLGLFDEAFLVGPPDGTAALVVDMRTRSVATREEAQTLARAKRASEPDPDRVRKCQEAWDRYRGAGDDVPAPAQATPAGAGVRKTRVVEVLKRKPLQPDPQER